MAVLGAMMASGSYICSHLTKLLSIDKIIIFAAVIENIMFIILFSWTPYTNDKNIWIYYTISGCFGFTNGIIKGQVPSMYSLIWSDKNDVAATSALQGLWEASASTILYSLAGIIYPISQLILVTISLNLGLILLLWAWKIKGTDKQYW